MRESDDIKRKAIYDNLCRDKTYPCQYCRREDPLNCDGARCAKWEKWFIEEWKKIKRFCGR